MAFTWGRHDGPGLMRGIWTFIGTSLTTDSALRRVGLTYSAIALRTGLPLLLLPLLYHRLGQVQFGIALTVQSLALLGSIITAYGFQSTGARDISLCRNAEERSGVVSQVLSAQLLLSLVTFLMVLIAAWATPVLRSSVQLMIATGIMAVVMGWMPVWYFQGRDRSPTGIGLDALGQLVVLISAFVLVHAPRDLHLALWLMIIGPLLSLTISALGMRRDGVGGLAFSRSKGWQAILGSFNLFLSRAGSASYTLSGVWLVALMATPVEASYFGVAAKIGGALLLALAPMSYVALPKASRLAAVAPEQVPRFVLRWGTMIVLLSLAIFVIVQVFAEWIIVALFSPEMAPAAGVTQLLAAMLVPNAIALILGTLILLPFRQDAQIAKAVVMGALTNIALAIPLVHIFGATGMAASRLGTEAVCTLVLLWSVLRGRYLRNQ